MQSDLPSLFQGRGNLYKMRSKEDSAELNATGNEARWVRGASTEGNLKSREETFQQNLLQPLFLYPSVGEEELPLNLLTFSFLRH